MSCLYILEINPKLKDNLQNGRKYLQMMWPARVFLLKTNDQLDIHMQKNEPYTLYKNYLKIAQT